MRPRARDDAAMPFRSGPIACSRFAVTGDAPDSPDDSTFARSIRIAASTAGPKPHAS